MGCVQWFKDTKLKANHNGSAPVHRPILVVSNGSKILNWKQITTLVVISNCVASCVQWFKDTKLKANHNDPWTYIRVLSVVSNGSKILNWKQITTIKGNLLQFPPVVSNGSKILNWKQITTIQHHKCFVIGCVQWFKDTKLKANHNDFISEKNGYWLCPMVQRY